MANHPNGTRYTPEQRAAFLELAAEIGIGRAMRELGYPRGWGVAKGWTDAAGIEVPLNEVRAQSRAYREWYETEDLLLVVQEGIQRLLEDMQRSDLSPDEHKKMSEALQKYVNTWRLLKDKSTSINETQHKDSFDLELADVLAAEQARNALMEKEVQSDTA